MRIMIANLTAACVAATLLTPTPASAWHDEPIYRYAAQYREAVRDFERSVIRSRHLNRVHERIVDDLEDATGRFRSATRNLRNADRLFAAWHEIQNLHRQVELAIFADPINPARGELAAGWRRVRLAYQYVDRELVSYGGNPPGRNFPSYLTPVFYPPSVYHNPPTCREPPIGGHQRRPLDPPVLNPPTVFPPRTDPFSGSNHPSQWNPNRGQRSAPFSIKQERTDLRSYRTRAYYRPTPRRTKPIEVGANVQRITR